MKILKSKTGLADWKLTDLINNNQIPREDILSITSDGDGLTQHFNIFYYEEPKPEEEKKGLWF